MTSRTFELSTATDQEEAHLRQLLDIASVNDIRELNWRLNNLELMFNNINQLATMAEQKAAAAQSAAALAAQNSTAAVNKLNAFEATVTDANYVADFRDMLINGQVTP